MESEQSERYVNIPSFIFKDRRLAGLESIVMYLKDSQGMTYAQIAKLLNRDDRTIWTTYQRAKKKISPADDQTTKKTATELATKLATNATSTARSKQSRKKQSTNGGSA